MWFVFPQLAGLGRSSTARFYGIGSIDEARAYLAHPALGPRLDLCTRTVCRRNIEMSPGVQSRDDTRVPDGHEERDLDCISAGELSSAFGLPRWVGIELLCR